MYPGTSRRIWLASSEQAVSLMASALSPVMCSRTSSSQVVFMALAKENLLYVALILKLLGSEIIALLVGLI